MNYRSIKILFIITVILCVCCERKEKIEYPETKRIAHYDEYHGKKIHDPYRWLEDETSEEVKQWIEAQNTVTSAHLEKIPFRNAIAERLEQLIDYERISIPYSHKGKLFYSRNEGMQNQNVIYMQKGLDGEPQIVIDPNTLSEDGTISISDYSVSKDGHYFAYSISRGGSDWNEIYVIDLRTGKQLTDKIEWVKFSGISWYKDGFFYSRYEPEDPNLKLSQKNEYHTVFYHKLGTSQSKNELIYRNNDFPLRNYGAYTDKEENYLFLSESKSTSNNALYFKETKNIKSNFQALTDTTFSYDYDFINTLNDKFLLRTNDNAPKYRLMLADPQKPYRDNWIEFIPEQDFVIEDVVVTKEHVIIESLENACNKLLLYNYDGNFVKEIEMPTIGSTAGISGNKEDDFMFYGFMSYTYPTTVFKYDLLTEETKDFFRPNLDFNFDEYKTEQVFYKSKDGTKVPMFITMKKETKLHSKNPLLLYGYGGFNVSLTPRFSVTIIPFLENGGIYVVANIRGGGEFGKEWHLAGTKLQKRNVFDDFIAAAEYLIDNKYTSPKKIGIQGASNGGLLVGVCANQRPDLFKVVLPAVGVMDMLRFHKFTIGWAWVEDYGSSDDAEEFEYLLSYSPLHTIKDGIKYPATFVTTADHDDRVVPAHSFKYIAELQHKHKGDNPVLIRIETKAGHGAGKPISKIIEEQTDVISFLMYHTGMKPKY